MGTKRLEVLKASLLKKEDLFNRKLNDHFATVKEANGQPLNDKRNGPATLRKWERQNDALRGIQEGIAKTAKSIEREEGLIQEVDASRATLPAAILRLVDGGQLTQWRKYPDRFFVPGVDKARIIWQPKERDVAYKFYDQVSDPEQRALFRETYNGLRAALKEEVTTTT